MSRRTEKRRYGKYNKFDVVYADFGKNPHGIQGGIRPGIIISCDASNHDGAPQVSVVPLSSKLKDIPVPVSYTHLECQRNFRGSYRLGFP